MSYILYFSYFMQDKMSDNRTIMYFNEAILPLNESEIINFLLKDKYLPAGFYRGTFTAQQ
jgi:hypothetical protein